ncbi:MAG: DsbA family oxidoreductase, partial [Nitratireductor sp.]|nr:DsbA family oxidoreductase [Nitratireductor sp.]
MSDSPSTDAPLPDVATLAPPPLTIDIVSDVMCPWCFIGQRNLDAARKIVPDVDLDIRWRPYQLDPTLPPEGRDRRQYLDDKFGGAQRAGEIYRRVEEAGRASGIDFRFDLMAVSPNTLDAHRVIKWAGGVSPEVQDRLVRRLFELFFLEGANVGDHAVLVAAAKEAGMDGDLVGDLLSRDDDKQAVQQEIAHAQSMG